MLRTTSGISILCLLLSPIYIAQKPGNGQLTEKVMHQLVERILRYEFKPRRNSSTVFVSESVSLILDDSPRVDYVRIEESWLPKIQNIDFKLVPEERIDDVDKAFVFDIQERDGNYSLSSGWRASCEGGGKVWGFQISRGKAKLWPQNQGWGAVYCDTGEVNNH